MTKSIPTCAADLNEEEEKKAAFITAPEGQAQLSLSDDDPASSVGDGSLSMEAAPSPTSRCYRCDVHLRKTTKTGFKTPLEVFHCDVGMKSVLRAIRKTLLAKILAHVRLNKTQEERRICSRKRFKQGCLSFFLSDVCGGELPKRFVAKRVMELIKFFLDLQCDNKFAFIAT